MAYACLQKLEKKNHLWENLQVVIFISSSRLLYLCTWLHCSNGIFLLAVLSVFSTSFNSQNASLPMHPWNTKPSGSRVINKYAHIKIANVYTSLQIYLECPTFKLQRSQESRFISTCFDMKFSGLQLIHVQMAPNTPHTTVYNQQNDHNIHWI